MDGPDDYGSMQQVIERRFAHFLAGDKGFAERPDALLIDGGQVHADTVLRQISSMGISIPVFGMVKDDRHRTRALVTPAGATRLEFRAIRRCFLSSDGFRRRPTGLPLPISGSFGPNG